jgi:hypothetical protein
VGVARVGRLERDAGGPGREDHVEDLGQRHVVVVRPLVIAPAEVHARLVGGYVGEGVVQRLDVQPRRLAKLVGAERGVLDVPPHRQVRAVHLQHEAGARHRLVLVPHGLGDREQVLLVAAVVLVAEEQRDDAGRGGGEEPFLGAGARQRRAEVGGIGEGGGRITHRDRTRAGRRLAARAPGVAEHAAGHAGKIDEVPVLQRMAGPTEAGQAVLRVGRVRRLAHLTVVHDVEAGFGLLANDLGHRGPDAGGQRGGVDRHPLFLGEHRPDEIFRTRQAAGMRREEALGAAPHAQPLTAWCRGSRRCRARPTCAAGTRPGPRVPPWCRPG